METKTTIEIVRDQYGNCRLTVSRQKRKLDQDAFGLRHVIVHEANCLSEAEALRRALEVLDLTMAPANATTVAGWRVLEVGA